MTRSSPRRCRASCRVCRSSAPSGGVERPRRRDTREAGDRAVGRPDQDASRPIDPLGGWPTRDPGRPAPDDGSIRARARDVGLITLWLGSRGASCVACVLGCIASVMTRRLAADGGPRAALRRLPARRCGRVPSSHSSCSRSTRATRVARRTACPARSSCRLDAAQAPTRLRHRRRGLLRSGIGVHGATIGVSSPRTSAAPTETSSARSRCPIKPLP